MRSAVRLGETFIRREVQKTPEWGTPEWPMIYPTQAQKANPPEVVLQACRRFGHSSATFWCLFHGQWCFRWEERVDQVDWGTCQCPGCIEENMYYTGMEINTGPEDE